MADQHSLAVTYAEQLLLAGISLEEASAISRRFVEEYSFVESEEQDPDSLGLLVKNYAIRKDDLALFEPSRVAMIAYSARDALTSLSSWVVAIFAILSVLRDLYKKGCHLDDDSIAVLSILKAGVPEHTSPGMLIEEILEVAKRNNPTRNEDWLNETLERLQKVPVRIGTNKEFVSRHMNRWRCHV